MLHRKFLAENIPKQYPQTEYDGLVDTLKNNFPTSLNSVLTIISDLITGKFCQKGKGRFIVITGPPESGKTLILNTLSFIFGDYNTRFAASPGIDNYVARAKLKNKLLVTINECDLYAIHLESVIKPLITLDTVPGKNLYNLYERIDITETTLVVCMDDITYSSFALKEMATTIRCENAMYNGHDFVSLYPTLCSNIIAGRLYSYILFKNKQHQETLMTWLLVSLRLPLCKDTRLFIWQYIKDRLSYC